MGRPVMEIGQRLSGNLRRSAMLAIVSFTMLAVIAVANPFLDAAQEMSCCSLAAGSCRNDCSKISLVALGAEAEARENATQRLLELCSLELTEFWGCVNSTLNEVKRHENWTGRRCCYLVQNPICRSTCALSGSRRNLNESCRPSDEPEFFSCLERREEAEHCCGKVSNETCRTVCQNLFYKREKISSRNGCFHQMPKCLKSVTEVKHAENPKQHLHCCNKADSLTCMETCKKILYTATTDREILNALTEKCGPPISPQSPFWSCLMKSGSPKPVRLPLDAGKLSCCTKAIKPKCQDLCWRAFKADWESSWHPLDAECLSSSQEGELRRCLEDTDDPCEMGCAGLSYCTRFNDRSTTLFRSCSATTDEAAKFEAHHWSRGGIIRGLSLPIRVAATCPPETLRAAACLLQLRPCETKSHETRLCREDCLELMASCVDWSAITGPHTAATLCAKLSPAKSDAPCVSLKPFLEDPQDNESVVRLEEDITTPCKINPCAQGEICQLLHYGRQAYRCVPACFLGKMSKQLVPVGSWVQIPSFNQGSHQICQCTSYGLDKCKILNYVKFNPCSIHNQIIAHKANFYVECNPCHCFEGEYTCSKKNCGEIPSLPCDCPPHYVPVCGKLGFTFASGCLATCARMSVNDVEFGSCSSRDPCASNPCDTTEKCVARSRVCLSELHKPCRQYECVPLDCDPRDEAGGPVCDKENRQHRSVCAMIRAGATLGYRGHCLEGCTLRGPVCGANGEVYANECAAWAERTVVDYFGPCAAVGLIGDQAKPRCGDLVQCPRLIEPYCVGVTPPGACCPVCGGAAKLFYSKKQLDRIYYVMKEDIDKDTVTLEVLLSALARQIQVAQCVLRGMMTPDRDIFIVVQPTSKRPSSLQLRACVTETEKLVTRILERSPKITVEVPLSALIRAEIAHSYISSAMTIGGYVAQIFLPIFLCVYVIF